MSSRSRDAQHLARLLTEHTGVEVRVTWHGNSKSHGGWHVEWTDGPTADSMRAAAATFAPSLPPVVESIRAYDRGSTDLAEAVALVVWLTQHPKDAQGVSSFAAVAQDAHDKTEDPQRADEATTRRARALLAASGGTTVNWALVRQLAHGQPGAVIGTLEWLDRRAAAEDPDVPDLVEYRRRKQAR